MHSRRQYLSFKYVDGYNCLVDIAEKLKKPAVLRNFEMNFNVPMYYNQGAACITWQYNVAIWFQIVETSLVSATSTYLHSS